MDQRTIATATSECNHLVWNDRSYCLDYCCMVNSKKADFHSFYSCWLFQSSNNFSLDFISRCFAHMDKDLKPFEEVGGWFVLLRLCYGNYSLVDSLIAGSQFVFLCPRSLNWRNLAACWSYSILSCCWIKDDQYYWSYCCS